MTTPATGRLIALAILDLAILIGGVMGWPAGPALAIHALLTALGYAVWLRGGGAIGLAPAILGVLGPWAILIGMPFAGRPQRAMRDDEAVFGPPPTPPAPRRVGLAVARMLDGRVHHAAPDTLGSLVTIMRHGDVAARRRALETVVRSFEPALSPLIALALTDADQTIRALAAAASARVAQNLTIARETLAVKPGGGPALAALLADHARSDVLLSDSQRRHLRADAVAAIAACPVEPEARAAIAIEALWAAGDHAAIDRLAATAPGAAATWWHAQAAT